MKNIDELLRKLNACKGARDWAQGKTFEEVYTTCERGEWLNWLFARTNPEDDKLLTLAKGHQANTVRHLMTDERSLTAVDTAIAFGEGRATKEELSRAAAYIYAAYTAAAADAGYAAAADAGYAAEDASYFSVWAARAAADAADADDAAWAAAEAAWAAAWAACIADDAAAAVAWAAEAARARQSNRQLTAEIFRKYISIEKFKI